MGFKVESDIEIPKRSRRSKYVEILKELKKGQSVSETEDGSPLTASNVVGFRSAAKVLNLELAVRKIDKGYRVWNNGPRTAESKKKHNSK